MGPFATHFGRFFPTLLSPRLRGEGGAARHQRGLPPKWEKQLCLISSGTILPNWPPAVANRVEIIHPSHTTVRTVRYTAVRFFGQEYIPACHFFRFLKIILSPPFRIFASSAIFRQEVSPITAFCFNV